MSALAHPFDVVRRARSLGIERVCVGFSGGKDAAAALHLCCQHFREVRPYFMYIVPNLQFQERYLSYIEKLLSVSIIRLPHWMLSSCFKNGLFRQPTARSSSVKKISIRDVENHVRKLTGIEWTATGKKAIDSVERNAQARACNFIDEKRRELWPVGQWNHAAVFNYLKQHNIALPPDYNTIGAGRSFSGFWGREMVPIKQHFPADYRKIVQLFPEVEAQVVRYEQRAANDASKEEATA